ncbi:MAG: T9SS type A sorting domain-containing protein [Flavobacterium sp.]|nr:MAG: T9SS type A sorting domain-containing protein [Flavobacterium sp.]
MFESETNNKFDVPPVLPKSFDAEQLVVFMVERGSEIIARSSTSFNYRSNTNMGTLKKPVELHFVKQSGDITVYPNPFTSNINIAIDLRGMNSTIDHKILGSVTDVSGRLVMQMPLKTISGISSNITWNGRSGAGSICEKGIYFINVTIDGIPRIYKVIKQ